MIRILFLVPPSTERLVAEKDREVNDAFGTYPPLGMMYLATYLRERLPGKVDVRIEDCSVGVWDDDRFATVIRETDPHIVGMTTFTPSILETRRALKRIRAVVPGCVTVLGGPHVTSFGPDALCWPEIDYGIMGYGELSFLALIEALFFKGSLEDVPGLIRRENGTIAVQSMRDDQVRLDELPIPDRTLVPYKDYRCPVGTQEVMTTLISSRGCPFPCTFCNSCDKKYRTRSVADVVKEVRYLAGLGIKEVFFFDDLFNLNNKRVFEFCAALEREKIVITWGFKSRVSSVDDELLRAVKNAGCERIHFGIEADTDEVLKELRKMITVDQVRTAVSLCNKHKITCVGSFMLNLPGDTRQALRRRIDFAKSLDLDYVQFGVLIAYSHTEIFRRGVEEMHWPADVWLQYVRNPSPDFLPPIWPNGIPREELYETLRDGLSGFYLRPAYVFQRLRKIRSMDQVSKYARGALKMLRLRKHGIDG